MRSVSIPNTDLNVASLCLGTSNLGTSVDRATSFALLDAYHEAGGNLLDTASVYANWLTAERSVSEKTIGRWLTERGLHGQVLVGTKGGHPELSTMHIPRLSPAEVRADLEASLRNLQVDAIDLYWLHRDDPARPVAEIMETLHAFVAAGKVRYVGCSNWAVARIREAQAYAARQGWVGFVADQVLWNVAVYDPAARADVTTLWMDAERERYHLETGMAALAFSAQAGGLFQKMAAGLLPPPAGAAQVYPREANARQFQRIRRIAAEAGLTVTQVVLGYVQSQAFPSVPIVGCKTLAQLRDSLTAADTRLSEAQVALLSSKG